MTLRHHRALADLLDLVTVAGGTMTAVYAPIGRDGTHVEELARVPTVHVALGRRKKRVQAPTFTGCAVVLSAWVLAECAKQDLKDS
jgi:hypothetical protein